MGIQIGIEGEKTLTNHNDRSGSFIPFSPFCKSRQRTGRVVNPQRFRVNYVQDMKSHRSTISVFRNPFEMDC